jgi:hypothetical protein
MRNCRASGLPGRRWGGGRGSRVARSISQTCVPPEWRLKGHSYSGGHISSLVTILVLTTADQMGNALESLLTLNVQLNFLVLFTEIFCLSSCSGVCGACVCVSAYPSGAVDEMEHIFIQK